MGIRRLVIENPVINSPFDKPRRHFRFSDEGITNEIVAGRRTSSYFIAIPAVNNHGEFGRWAFFEVRDPWNAKMEILAALKRKTV